MKRSMLAGVAAVISLACIQTASAADKKTLAFVVNGASDFWKAGGSGREEGAGRTAELQSAASNIPSRPRPPSRQRLMDDLVAAGVAGIMVSAVDPKTSTDALNRIGGQVPLFTTDSDAPTDQAASPISARSNTDAGKQAGQLMLKAMPNGGKCMGFVGLLGADNARSASRACKDGHQGLEGRAGRRARRRHRPDPRQAQRRGHADRQPRHQLHGRLLLLQHAAHLRGAEGRRQARQDQRSSASTRIRSRSAACKEGTIVGTVVQQPFEWGYQGMKLMAKYLEGDKSGIPANKLIIIPTKIIDKTNVDAFWAELKERQGKK